MATTIWKYSVALADSVQIEMPEGAVILSVGQQLETLCFWALVNPARPMVVRRFVIRETGHLASACGPENFLGTVQFLDSGLVVHVFENRVSDFQGSKS